jgi:HlyD family secretion protein
MKRNRNLLFLALGIVAVVALGVFSAVRPHAKPLDVRVTAVHQGHFTTTLPETGELQLARVQALPALVAGNLATLNVRAGEKVSAGDVIATIENPELESTLVTSQASAQGADARAGSAAETNAALPAQNRSAVVQAQANLEAARVALSQARQDLAAGAQSGLGYGGSTAEDQQVQADAAAAKADTDLREAQRINAANRDLYAQKAVSKDTLDQSQARLEEAQVAANQAHRERQILEGSLGRAHSVLVDRVRAAEDGLRQAQAALRAARATAAQSHSGDVQAAQDDASRAGAELSYAHDQVARLTIRAPFDGTIQAIANETGDTLRPIEPGDPVQVGMVLATIAGSGGFVVRAKVDEQDIASVRPGQRVKVSGEDFGGKSLAGHVVQISGAAQKSDDPSNTARQVVTTVALDRTLPFLRDGMTVDVDIVTHDQPHALTVPNDAIQRDTDQKPYVYRVVNGKAARTAVTTGAANDATTVITRGLAANDRVVAEHNPALHDGAPISAATPAPAPSGTARH